MQTKNSKAKHQVQMAVRCSALLDIKNLSCVQIINLSLVTAYHRAQAGRESNRSSPNRMRSVAGIEPPGKDSRITTPTEYRMPLSTVGKEELGVTFARRNAD